MNKLIMTATFFSVMTSMASAAHISSMKCEQDMRPVDGNYSAIELTRNEAGKYDLTYHVITSGFGGPVQDTRVEIAKNLSQCVFANEESRIVQCNKFDRDPGETTNTGFTSKRVSETAVSDHHGHTLTNHSFVLNVYSPQLIAGAGKPGFPYMERPGMFSVSFRVEGSQGVMVNRCTVD